MEQKLNALQRQLMWLRLLVVFLMLITGWMVTIHLLRDRKEPAILRARGIIIEDETGRDRILIGAPVPASGSRVRTDTALVRRHWSGAYPEPDSFMKWYRDYRHSTVGMVVMNESGFDRVLVGDQLADPNTGRRMFDASGILWNDREGWERGGAGVNTLKDGRARSIIGVDGAEGEAVHLMALEDGTNALSVRGKNRMLLLGHAAPANLFFRNKEPFTGLRLFDESGTLKKDQPF